MRTSASMLVASLLWCGSAPLPADQSGKLVESGISRCVIVHPRDCALSERVGRKLAEYLRDQTSAKVPLLDGGSFDAASQSAMIVLDGTPSHSLARRVAGQKSTARSFDVTGSRSDSYRLMTLNEPGKPFIVLALGKSPAGAKYAAYRLMRELQIENGSARIRPLDIKAEPFIKTRSVALFNVWGMPIELTRRHNTESWSQERLEAYVNMFDSFGFNAIESHDRFNDNYLEPLFGLKRADWRAKVQRMAAVAHDNEQEFFLRIWGHSVMETPKLDRELGPNASVPKKLKHLCANDAQERKEWEKEIRDYYVDHYAGRIDNLIGHWCDPGICRNNGCTYETPLRLQMDLHNAFKSHDPKFKSTFSLWYFDVTRTSPAAWARGGWEGYTGDFDLINSGILAKEVMIATASAGIPAGEEQGDAAPGKYKDQVVRAIIKAGHKPALWTWYRADHEIRPSLHIHLRKLLGEYFGSLPASARELEWHNIERNVHGAANTASYYVAGRLMWEPKLDPDDLLNEFLVLTFGSKNAPHIAPAYAAIEKIRCHSCDKNWANSRMTGSGTANPKEDARLARAALSSLGKVKIDPDYRPRSPLDVSQAQIIADLKASVAVIADFADLRATVLPALQASVSAGDRQKATSLLEDLDKKRIAWSLTLEGRQEAAVLQRSLNELQKQLSAR